MDNMDELDDLKETTADGDTSKDSGQAGKKTETAPLSPFDITEGESFLLYDNMKYNCDTDLCQGMIKIESGNVCKGYRLKETEPVKIGGDAAGDAPRETSTFEDSELENPEYEDDGYEDPEYDPEEEGEP
ncbi:MAG: hypothetical protein J6113_04180 [Lachnospiraceae bacterium]|nr:hypothetical protein [Lachnospiraceae bacterium]